MADFLSELRELVGVENFFDSSAELIAMASRPRFGDSPAAPPPPEAAARPVNLAQALDIFKLCRDFSREINIVGGATRPSTYRPRGKYIILSTVGLSRILDIDVANRLVVAQAGATLVSLNNELSKAGLYFPPVSVRAPIGSLGGAIAINAPTESGGKYGSIVSYVRELEIITGSLKRFSCSGQNGQPGKLAPSFPLAPLFCGSGGCLGLIGAAALNVLPAPEKTDALNATFAEDIQAAEAVAKLREAPIAPERLTIQSGLASSLASGDDKARVFLSYAGRREEVGAALTDAKDILKKCGVLEIMAPDRIPVAPSFPAALGKVRETYILTSIAFNPSSLPSAVEGVAGICRDNGVQFLFYGGAARLTFALMGKESEKARREIFHLELILNGRLRSEEDLARDRSEWRKRNSEITEISGEIRKIFDPFGLLVGAPDPEDEEPL